MYVILSLYYKEAISLDLDSKCIIVHKSRTKINELLASQLTT